MLYVLGFLIIIGLLISAAYFANSKVTAVVVSGIIFGAAISIFDTRLGIDIIKLCAFGFVFLLAMAIYKALRK